MPLTGAQVLHKDSIYVTDIYQCAILQFQTSTHQLLKKVGRGASGKGQCMTPRSLVIAPDSDLYGSKRKWSHLTEAFAYLK